ncbi:hypothetical protein J6590_062662 [Homalodisca vitripennis]|nr:hypothetical protein J6590_062662 [Homalodisca vitripennis]
MTSYLRRNINWTGQLHKYSGVQLEASRSLCSSVSPGACRRHSPVYGLYATRVSRCFVVSVRLLRRFSLSMKAVVVLLLSEWRDAEPRPGCAKVKVHLAVKDPSPGKQLLAAGPVSEWRDAEPRPGCAKVKVHLAVKDPSPGKQLLAAGPVSEWRDAEPRPGCAKVKVHLAVKDPSPGKQLLAAGPVSEWRDAEPRPGCAKVKVHLAVKDPSPGKQLLAAGLVSEWRDAEPRPGCAKVKVHLAVKDPSPGKQLLAAGQYSILKSLMVIHTVWVRQTKCYVTSIAQVAGNLSKSTAHFIIDVSYGQTDRQLDSKKRNDNATAAVERPTANATSTACVYLLTSNLSFPAIELGERWPLLPARALIIAFFMQYQLLGRAFISPNILFPEPLICTSERASSPELRRWRESLPYVNNLCELRNKPHFPYMLPNVPDFTSLSICR